MKKKLGNGCQRPETAGGRGWLVDGVGHRQTTAKNLFPCCCALVTDDLYLHIETHGMEREMLGMK